MIFTDCYFTISCEEAIKQNQKEQLKEISNDLAKDQIDAFNIAKNNGDWMQATAQASIVATFYLQAKNEVEYKKWSAIEKEMQAKYMKSMGL